jgi:hypothetical protein
MKRMNIFWFLGLILLLGSTSAWSEDYIYRDLMANTLPSARCLNKAEAESHAQDAYLLKKKEKVFCETQGYGWNLQEEKGAGKVACTECEGDANKGKFQCHLEDIVVACKRIKPGSVGLIPGKG